MYSAYGFLTVTVLGTCAAPVTPVAPVGGTTTATPASASTVDAAVTADVTRAGVLPATGAASDLKLLGVVGVALLAGGFVLVGLTLPRRRISAARCT